MEASDGKAALEIFKTELPDLILADINMPKLNGLEFASICKTIKPDVKICLVTGYDYFDYAVTALKLGVDDYILKPASKKDIGEALGKLINKISNEKNADELNSIVSGLKNKPVLEDDYGYKAKIQNAIEDNIGNPALSLTLLSEKMALSFGYLGSLFKKLFGIPFQDYVLAERMERAKILLLSTDMKNYEIAEAVGFEDPNYFSTAFKKKYGVSPNRYKEKVRVNLMMKPKAFRTTKFQITSFYFFASLIAIFLMGFILYNSFFNIELSQDLKSTKVAIEKSGNYVELTVNKLKVLSNILAKDHEAIRYLTGKENPEAKNLLSIQLKNTIESDPSIKSIIIVGKDGRLISNEKTLNMSKSNDMMKEQWYVDAIDSNSMPILTKARMQKFSMDKDNWVISISQPIKDAKGDNLGVLLIDVRYKIMDTFLSDLNVGDKDYVFILNDRNEVVYHKDTNYFTNPQLQNKLIQVSKMSQGYNTKRKILI